jgi:hypothetical protein
VDRSTDYSQRSQTTNGLIPSNLKPDIFQRNEKRSIPPIYSVRYKEASASFTSTRTPAFAHLFVIGTPYHFPIICKMAENEAAWITAPAENPFRVGSAPKPKPGSGQVVIRNRAVAIVSPITPKDSAYAYD